MSAWTSEERGGAIFAAETFVRVACAFKIRHGQR